MCDSVICGVKMTLGYEKANEISMQIVFYQLFKKKKLSERVHFHSFHSNNKPLKYVFV